MSKQGRDLLDYMRSTGLDEYGSVISVDDVRSILGLEFPAVATQGEFNRLQLEELGAVDYVRNALLNEGKYIKSNGGAYRVLLPSENHEQVMLYMSSAEKKLKRAIKLEKNTPATSAQNGNQSSRALLKIRHIQSKAR